MEIEKVYSPYPFTDKAFEIVKSFLFEKAKNGFCCEVCNSNDWRVIPNTFIENAISLERYAAGEEQNEAYVYIKVYCNHCSNEKRFNAIQMLNLSPKMLACKDGGEVEI